MVDSGGTGPAVRHTILSPRSFVSSIFVVFLSLALILLGLLSGIAYFILRDDLTRSAQSEMAALVDEKAAAIQRWIGERVTHLDVLATWSRFDALGPWPARGQASTPTQERLLGELRADLRRWTVAPASVFTSVMLLHPESGRVLASSEPLDEGKIKRFRRYFIEGRHAPFIQNPFYSLSRNAVIMAVSEPVWRKDGSLLGVLVGEVGLQPLDGIVRRQSGLIASAEAYVVNNARLFITQPKHISNPAVLRRANYTDMVSRCLMGGSGVITADDHDGRSVIAAYRWIEARAFCVVAQAERQEVLRGVNRLIWSLLVVAVGALLVGMVVALFFARTLARPVERMAAAARQLGQGDLSVRLAETERNELGELATEFNAMADRLLERDRELRRSNRELEQFAYVASHDLQEPLRKITSFGNLILEEKSQALDQEGREYLNYIIDAGRRMRSLIDDLLAYSRVATRAAPFEPVDLSDLLTSVREDLELAIQDARADIKAAPLPTVMADPGQMRQLLQNLLSNALKYRKPNESARIDVTAARDASGKGCTLAIDDTGIGFDPAYAEEIFKPFRRLHGRSTYPGTGMGLAICRRIVERHGGTIEARGMPGQGATFLVRLPLEHVEGAPAHE